MMPIKMGYALTGSFCMFERSLAVLEQLIKLDKYDITPLMSEISYATDTRFGKAADWRKRLIDLTGKPIIHTIVDAEPVGPQALFDVLVIAPCTGNTIGKLAAGITDTAVLMAAKGHLRGGRPVVLNVSSNDALSGSAQNIGRLLARRDIYFVPMAQDDPEAKPRSIVAEFERIGETADLALQGKQIQPIFFTKR